MGLTKQYLRYAPSGKFNIIANANCNVVFVVVNNESGRYLAAGASEDIIVWDLRLCEKKSVITGEKHQITQLAASPNKVILAAGLSDGSVKTYDLNTTENLNTFSGHRSAVTCFAFDQHGHRLASGAKDTEIVIWDLVAETGLKRLSGHKGVVTQVQFMIDRDVLVSSSKDTFIKLWDISSAHCFKTIAGHITEVWGLALMRGDDFILAGSADSELRVWQVKDINEMEKENKQMQTTLLGEDDCTSQLSPVACTKAGSVLRSGRGRVISISIDSDRSVLAVHGNDYCVELFQFLSEEEANQKLKKRLRKARKKATKSGDEVQESLEETVTLSDVVKRLPTIKCPAKVKSVNLVLGNGRQLRVAVGLANNALELYGLDITDCSKVAEVPRLRRVERDGHHSDVRAVAFSSDNLAVASGSGDSVKMWNRPSLASLRTVDTNYILSVIFVPGDRHVLAGRKDGHLLIIDISVGDILEDIPAHSSELWSICQLPDLTGVVTGGGDNTVKMWQLELVPDTVTHTKAKVLSLLHTRTLDLDEAVLCVRVSSNSKLLAVALLDSTVKIFFMDTFKFFLSLYGHKLPVLCMDISSDCTLIATGSADRNVKIWGLDFGDCHKSLFAHDDSVTGLSFVPNTHYFFTCGKDGKVKQWDADNFQKIVTLQGHHGEAWGLAISPNGEFVVSCGQDRVLRLYEKTAEPLVLEDEQEAERAAEEEATLATGPDTITTTNVSLASRKTVTAEKAAELLLECLQVGGEYRAAAEESKKAKVQPPPPPVIMAAFGAKTADDYLLEIIKRIKASDLEEALLLLPYTSVCELLPLLKPLLSQTLHSDIVCRLLVFLVKVHHRPISASPEMQPLIEELSNLAMKRTAELRDLIGENYHGLLYLQREMEAREGVQLFRDATVDRKEREKKKRRREKALKRVILTL